MPGRTDSRPRLLILLVGAAAAYVLFKYAQRRRLMRRLRVARVTAEELNGMLAAEGILRKEGKA